MALFEIRALWDKKIVQEHLLPRIARRFSVEGKRRISSSSPNSLPSLPDRNRPGNSSRDSRKPTVAAP